MSVAVAVKDLEFRWPKQVKPILSIQEFSVQLGEHVFLKGPSGSGKTSFLSLVTGLMLPTKGQISLFGRDIGVLSSRQRDQLRSDRIGYIFQMFNLIPYLSVQENILLPLRFSKRRRQKLLGRQCSPVDEVRRLLESLQLTTPGLAQAAVGELSIGQQQRIAVARALIGAPELIVADEPTSALDSDAKMAFLQLLQEECNAQQTALVYVSHDFTLADTFDRQVDIMSLKPA